MSGFLTPQNLETKEIQQDLPVKLDPEMKTHHIEGLLSFPPILNRRATKRIIEGLCNNASPALQV